MQKEIRDADIATLSLIRDKIDVKPEMSFVLTGSYSVEALTGCSMEHDDIDVNVFSQNLEKARLRVLSLSDSVVTNKEGLIEFDMASEIGLPIRRVEIGLIKTRSFNRDIFCLHNEEDKLYKVPTEVVPLIDSKGNEFLFRVKSLPYAIATWMIRISGIATNKKREIRGSDINHLTLLLNKNYKYGDVINAMKDHPQMPEDVSEGAIFERVISLVNK